MNPATESFFHDSWPVSSGWRLRGASTSPAPSGCLLTRKPRPRVFFPAKQKAAAKQSARVIINDLIQPTRNPT
ncbi:MAG: hypothetical protein AUF76_09590 [Acidobacteria bacterium 13_1_20CM_2_65_9]|nr:MAG: hypothetical protein AUF76_09590 [Acidobacteria bacterium 13_1_20CM_2_65_9]